jgi:diketogulonate reductase-like aldo/keto reductase
MPYSEFTLRKITIMRTLQLPSGQTIPVLGMGTWRMGENARNRQTEIDALRHGLDPIRFG